MLLKNKKGFTLVELLVAITISLIILGTAVISIVKISESKRQEAYKIVEKQIISAAEQYFETNKYLFEGLDNGSIGVITVGKLVDEDYLNKVTDPRNGKEINKCNEILFTKTNNGYSTTYQENSKKNCQEIYNVVEVFEPGAPSVEISLKGDLGENSWYVSNVILTTNISTEGNGVIKKVENCIEDGDVCIPSNELIIENKYEDKISDTKSKTVVYKATNISGKTAVAIVSDIKVDTIKPTCEIEVNFNDGNLGNKVGDVQWYINTDFVDISLEKKANDDLSSLKNYGLNYNNKELINLKDNIVLKEESKNNGKTIYGYVKDDAGNEGSCKASIGVEKSVKLVFDTEKSNKAKSLSDKILFKKVEKYDSVTYGVCPYGGCSDIKCKINENEYCPKEYFAKSCMNVGVAYVYFNVEGLKSASIAGSIEVNDGCDEENYGSCPNGIEREGSCRRKCKWEGQNDEVEGKQWTNEYYYKDCGIKDEGIVDFCYNTYTYESPAGNKSNLITLYTQYSGNCGYK